MLNRTESAYSDTYGDLTADERQCLHHLDSFFQKGLINHFNKSSDWWLSSVLKSIGATTLWVVSSNGTTAHYGKDLGFQPDETFLKRFIKSTNSSIWVEGHPEIPTDLLRIPLDSRGHGGYWLITGFLEGSVCKECNAAFLTEFTTRIQFSDIVLKYSRDPDLNTQHSRMNALENTLIETRRQLTDSRTSGKFAALRRLSGGIAHEFNNQIGIILGFIEFARSREDESATHQALDMTTRSCRRMHDIISRLLSFSHRHQLKPIETDLNDIVRSVAAELESQFTERAIRLHLDLEELPKLWLDRRSFDMGIREVLINAMHACPSGQSVKALTRNRNGNVKFLVCDSGMGMSPEDLDRICEPFYTSKGALGSGVEDGIGLGLSTTRSTVLLHNGHMILHSRQEQGSAIGFSIPRKDTYVDDGPVTEADIRVLAVDRNQDFLDRISVLLKVRGYNVDTQSDGLGALNAVGARPPHVILFGEQLTDMGGLELKSTLDSFVGHIPAILCTDRLRSDLVRQATRAGVTHFLESQALDSDLDEELRHSLKEVNIVVDRSAAADSTPQTFNILIVDDEPNMGYLLTSLLEPKGHNVTVIQSPLEVLDLDINMFDLAFIDLIMPDIDGTLLTRRMRDLDFTGTVVWMTGHSKSDVHRDLIDELNIRSVLEKPLHMSQILNALEDVSEQLRTTNSLTLVNLPDKTSLLSVDGAMDQGTLTALRTWITKKRPGNPLIVDLTACGFLEATALSTVISLDLAHRRDGFDVILIVTEEQRRQIGATQGQYRLPGLCETLKEARSRIRR